LSSGNFWYSKTRYKNNIDFLYIESRTEDFRTFRPTALYD